MGTETGSWLGAAAALLSLAACTSSAPYTLPAAVINAAVAGGTAAQSRGAGGCYAVCTNGTRCNPASGFCEPIPKGCQEGQPCSEADWRAASVPPPLSAEARPSSTAKAGELAPGAGLSPATGRAPSLPAYTPATGPASNARPESP